MPRDAPDTSPARWAHLVPALTELARGSPTAAAMQRELPVSSEYTAHVLTRAGHIDGPEWVGALRVYAPGQCYDARDPYDWCAMLVKTAPGVVSIEMVREGLRVEMIRPIRAAIERLGFQRAEWERHNTGVLRRRVAWREDGPVAPAAKPPAPRETP